MGAHDDNVIPFPGAAAPGEATATTDDLASGALKSGWLTQGFQASALRALAADHLGGRHVLPVAGGTTALRLALLALDLAPDDEVIIPALGTQPVVNLVVLAGGRPVLADVTSVERPFLDPGQVERLLTRRTRAVLVDHYHGFPAPLDDLVAITAAHGVTLVEDCRQALGAVTGGEPVGTRGDLAVFGFGPAPDGGGFVATGDEAARRRLEELRSTAAPLEDDCLVHDCTVTPHNGYRIDEAAAATGVRELSDLPATLERRRAVALAAAAAASQRGLIAAGVTAADPVAPAWRYLLLVASDDQGRRRLQRWATDAGLEASTASVARPVPLATSIAGGPDLPVAEDYDSRAVEVAVSPALGAAVTSLP